MTNRIASLLISLVALTTACKGTEPRPAQPATAGSGRAARADGGAASGAGPAATGDPWSRADAAREPLRRPLLWSLTKDGTTSYLLGTMHAGVDPDRRLPDLVWTKLDAARQFAMETDLGGAARLDVLRKDGKTLRDELGDAYWAKLENALGAQEAARMLAFKPMIPAMVLSTRGLPSTVPMDSALHARALRAQKPVVFLEPLELQFAVLEKWMDARALEEMLDDVAEVEQLARDMLAAYLDGDEPKLLAIAERERARFLRKGRTAAEYAQQMEDVVYRRNASWIAPIEKLHADGGGFIAVGAMHAIGPRSVLELLASRGSSSWAGSRRGRCSRSTSRCTSTRHLPRSR